MDKRLVLIGGGHAHMETLANLKNFVSRGHSVSLIAPSPFHYYSGMGPGMLSGIYAPDDIRFATRHVVEKYGGVFVPGRAVRIDPDLKTVLLSDGSSIPYDVLSCNVGSFVPQTIPVSDTECPIFSVKPIEKLLDARKLLLSLAETSKIQIAVVGGGPSALEIAGNTWRLLRDSGGQSPSIKIFAGRRFMERAPEAVHRRVRTSLDRRNIEILEPACVEEIRDGKVVLDSGAAYGADFLFMAVGIKPSPLFADSGLPVGPDGGLQVNEFLQCPAHPEIFGGGDCIHFAPQPLDKVGVYSVRQNPVLCQNLLVALEGGGSLRRFDPGGAYLLIYNLGDGTGVLHKKWFEFNGRLAFRIKNYIDRKFMKKFQALE
jgi:NADH dehydrogenase FAD-containing subunit